MAAEEELVPSVAAEDILKTWWVKTDMGDARCMGSATAQVRRQWYRRLVYVKT